MNSFVSGIFHIKEIDSAQIHRYYKSAGFTDDPGIDEKREKLVEMILKVDLKYFKDLSNNKNEAVEKERLKAIIRLYLAIIYLVTKSLVRINTSYSIGFAAYARDYLYFYGHEPKPQDDFMKITNDFSDNNWICGRVKHLYQRNNQYYDDEIFRLFRNSVEHLNAIQQISKYSDSINKEIKSYFDLYHFLILKSIHDELQKRLAQKEKNINNSTDTEKNNAEADNYRAKISSIEKALPHQSAYKDFLYGIMAPLAYNNARYINLTCKDKFIESYGK